MGPYSNRQETYAYFSLPFCVGTKTTINHYHETLSEALQGVELEFSGYEIDFKDDISATEICMVELNEEKVRAFAYAVKNDYWYQMYIDGLPIWGKVGEKEDKKYYIYTHKRFDIGYNNKKIVDINIQTDKKELLTPGAKIKFTYEVNWKPSNIKFEDRFDKYLDPTFFQHRVSVIQGQKLKDRLLTLVHSTDTLVQHIQQLHDGHIFGGFGVHDFDENIAKGLPTIQQGRRNGRYGRLSV